MVQDIHSSKTPPHLAGLNILIVEDSPINLKVTSQTLQSLGAHVIETQNGEESITAMNPSLDAVLMDIEMPIMDGITATKIIRNNPQYNHIPIIAITAHDHKEDEKSCFQAGMNDFITKPLEPENLLQVLRDNINQLQNNSAGPIDFTEGIAKVGGDQTFFHEVLQDFCHLHHNEGKYLSQLFAKKEFAEIQKRAHRLKGVAGTIRAQDFAKTAKDLEILTKNKPFDLLKIEKAIIQITKYITEIIETINDHTARPQL